MARLPYGGTRSDYVQDTAGNVKPGTVVEVRDAATEAVITDLVAPADYNGTAFPAGKARADADGLVAFQGPDGFAGDVDYRAVNALGVAGPWVRLPRDAAAAVAALEASLPSTYVAVAGTDPASIPVVKPSGDTRPGVWEFVHNSGTGYLFHLLAGANFAAPAAILAIGNDNGNGASILLPNKASGNALVIDQRATVTSPAAYGMVATQRSTAAPLVRLEQNVSGAADALQLLAFNAPDSTPPTAAQRILYVGDPTGFAGGVFAADGRLEWRRPVRIRAKDGTTDSYLDVTENTGYTYEGPGGYHHRVTKHGPEWWSDSGGGSWWPFKIRSSGSHLYIEAGGTSAVLGTATRTPLVDFQNGKIGFFGVTPVTRPAAIASPAADVTALKTAVDALRVALTSLGLTS